MYCISKSNCCRDSVHRKRRGFMGLPCKRNFKGWWSVWRTKRLPRRYLDRRCTAQKMARHSRSMTAYLVSVSVSLRDTYRHGWSTLLTSWSMTAPRPVPLASTWMKNCAWRLGIFNTGGALIAFLTANRASSQSSVQSMFLGLAFPTNLEIGVKMVERCGKNLP